MNWMKNALALATADFAAPAAQPQPQPMLDSAKTPGEGEGDDDSLLVATPEDREIAARIVEEFAETELEEGEDLGERLLALIVGATDADFDGEIGEEEAEEAAFMVELVADALVNFGVPEADAVELLEDFDSDVAERVHELLLDKLPEGEDAMLDSIGKFVDDGLDADNTMLDAVYKNKIVVRGGKKMKVRKRISGVVRLTGAQKVAVRKMLRKSQTGLAKMRRRKSMAKRRKLGL